MVSKMGDYANNPDVYQVGEDDKTYFYLLVGVSIAVLAIMLITIS